MRIRRSSVNKISRIINSAHRSIPCAEINVRACAKLFAYKLDDLHKFVTNWVLETWQAYAKDMDPSFETAENELFESPYSVF